MNAIDGAPACWKCGQLIPYDIGPRDVPSQMVRVIVGVEIKDGRTMKQGRPYHFECRPTD